jgi:alkylation response protein AidB-like acyl-CoA dehydrogenase
MIESLILTSKFVAERHQFGRPIGSFQAIQHWLATAYVMAEGARWLTRRAAATPDDEYLTAYAAAYACEAADNVFTSTHQTSRAIGLTTE